jgi:hypothetical protein
LLVARWQLGPAPPELDTSAIARPPLVLRDQVADRAELEAATERLNRGDSDALDWFAERAVAKPTDVDARIGLALASFRADRPQTTIDELDSIAAEFPDEASPRLHAGIVLLVLDRAAEAAPHLRAARRLGWQHPTVSAGIAGRADDLLHPSLPPGYPPLLIANADLPSHSRPAANTIRRAIVAGDRQKAAKLARRLSTSSTNGLRIVAALAAWSKDDPEATVSALRAMRSAAPRDGSLLVHLGLVEIWSGQRAAGMASLNRAATHSGDPAWKRRAKLLLGGLATA